MATYTPPKRATEYTTYVSLISQASTYIWQTSVTLASGDVQVSKDGGSFANISTLPTEIDSSGVLSVTLTSTEMTADTVVVRFHDTAGDEWCDALIVIHTAENEIDDLVSAATMNKIADHVIRRNFENACDSSDGDTKAFRSLLGAIAKLVNRVEAVGSTLTIYEDDDSTSLGTQTITTDSGASPITKLDTV